MLADCPPPPSPSTNISIQAKKTYPNFRKRKTTPIHDRMLAKVATSGNDEVFKILSTCEPAIIPKNVHIVESHVKVSVAASSNDYSPHKGKRIDALITGKWQFTCPSIGKAQKAKVLESGDFWVIVEIKTEIQSLSGLFDQVMAYKDGQDKETKVDNKILIICPVFEDYEERALLSQGVHILKEFDCG